MADNAPLYRAILNVFAASKRQFRLHLRPDDVCFGKGVSVAKIQSS
jgi:hypothetical protein